MFSMIKLIKRLMLMMMMMMSRRRRRMRMRMRRMLFCPYVS
jgi:hypothetical protein